MKPILETVKCRRCGTGGSITCTWALRTGEPGCQGTRELGSRDSGLWARPKALKGLRDGRLGMKVGVESGLWDSGIRAKGKDPQLGVGGNLIKVIVFLLHYLSKARTSRSKKKKSVFVYGFVLH